MDFDDSAPGVLVWYHESVEVKRKTGRENTWTSLHFKDNNDDVFDCQLEHYTLPRPKWSQVSCEDKIVMDVQYSPTVNIQNPTDVTLIEGDAYIAVCLIDSNPAVEGIWIHPDGSFTLGSSLEINSISRTDGGRYICFAETVFWDGSTASDNDSLHIDVQFPANISLVGPSHVYEGNHVVLLCSTTDANPRPYEMYINHTDDNGNDNVVAEVEYDIHVLYIITSISEEHSGTYTCYAESRFYDGTIGESTSNEITVNILQYSPEDNTNGVIFALIIVIILLFAVIVISWKPSHTAEYEDLRMSVNPDHVYLKHGEVPWEIQRESIRLGKTIAEGYFGKVMKATAIIGSQNLHSTVAVKMLKGPTFFVLEYMALGDLQTYLRREKNNEENTYTNLRDRVTKLSQHNRIGFSHQISLAMEFIEGKGCVHRDLAARNVLLNEKLVCKLSGFGLATDVLDQRDYEK
ncbi:fibroblast growth factor receptor-like [Saccoglossus kowalevskii]|uniref:Fibroblast growth factor receptor-like n=1 Tax=Saccoglossus kowalevskii TaxID=10224 RepID=A0ABM0LYR9_SACKO|nr:PREDICTED: fibroblast growth factor receptor-like [Saccoglossus kowalevskii]